MGDGRWACQATLHLFWGVPIQPLLPVSLYVLLFIVAPFAQHDFLGLFSVVFLLFPLKQACDSSPRTCDITRNPKINDNAKLCLNGFGSAF